MRSGEDPRCGLPEELLDRERRVLPAAEHGLAQLDERTHERTKLVQGRALPLDVLLEGERKLRALFELPPEDDESAEDEATEQGVQVRRAHDHGFGYAAMGSSPAHAQT